MGSGPVHHLCSVKTKGEGHCLGNTGKYLPMTVRNSNSYFASLSRTMMLNCINMVKGGNKVHLW